MLSGLEIALAVAACVAGVTGSWSPCGFSMVETIGPTGHEGGRRTTLTACATFTVGALAGGALTFGSLAAIGGLLHGAAGPVAGGVAVAVALAAALGEARGVRIVPQVRRQVPEHWRRVMPLPLAAGLYGVLLGLGFTTFVLTLAVWALAGISVALGDPGLGVVVGLAFGVGRALPIIALAPLAGSAAGIRALETMAERPRVLRGFRLADAVAMAALALALVAAPATAATRVAAGATDPSAAGDALAWQVPGAASVLSTGGALRTLAGVDPAVGGPFLATRAGTAVTVVRREDLAPIATFDIPGADKLAVSERWLVARVRGRDGGDVLQARALAGTGQVRGIAAVPAPAQLGRPALDGDLLVYHVAGRRSGRIVLVNLATGRRRTAREAAGAQLTNPSLLDRRLLYVRATPRSQTLMLGTLGRPAGDRVLYRIAALARRDAGHDPGKRPHRRHYRDPDPPPRDRTGAAATLWSTALTARAAYVTRVRALGGHTTASLLRVRR